MTRVLVVNAGSSSLKLAVLDADDAIVAAAAVEEWDGVDTSSIARVIEQSGGVDAAGHRVVHGGPDLRGPVVLDAATEAAIEALTPLARIHQPRALAAIRATRSVLPRVPAVACFDTAFHATLPAAAATYALPLAWRRLGVRRFGFHGLSHAWASRRAAELLAQPIGELRMVTAHLGAGASLCAVAAGRSVDTTMGFTPLDGLVMATRAGSVDPGLVLWLQREHAVGAAEVEATLEHRSGLLGLFGTSGDMRDVLRGVEAGNDDARLAYEVYLHRLRSSIAAMAASMGGLDALVFTGGIGEHACRVRADTCAQLGFLGVVVDADVNRVNETDADLSRAGAAVSTLVVTAREDLQIAGETRATLTR